VLRIIGSIGKHERAARKIGLKISRCRERSRLYKKHLSTLARYRIPVAWKVRDLELRNSHHDRLVGLIKDIVYKAVAYEREIRALTSRLKTAYRPENARVIREKIKRLHSEMKQLEN
jgi:hypothetical protein